MFPERQGKWKATTQSREFLKSIKRYYSNAYTDGEKQDAINLLVNQFFLILVLTFISSGADSFLIGPVYFFLRKVFS